MISLIAAVVLAAVGFFMVYRGNALPVGKSNPPRDMLRKATLVLYGQIAKTASLLCLVMWITSSWVMTAAAVALLFLAYRYKFGSEKETHST